MIRPVFWRKFLTIVAALVAPVGGLVAAGTPGPWPEFDVLVIVPAAALVALGHLIMNLWVCALTRVYEWRHFYFVLMADLMLVFGFAMQVGPRGGGAIGQFVEAHWTLSHPGILCYNVAVFAPWLLAWIKAVREQLKDSREFMTKHCNSCGYPMPASRVCPECGTPARNFPGK